LVIRLPLGHPRVLVTYRLHFSGHQTQVLLLDLRRVRKVRSRAWSFLSPAERGGSQLTCTTNTTANTTASERPKRSLLEHFPRVYIRPSDDTWVGVLNRGLDSLGGAFE
jgi:hypothetical protein